MDRPRAWVLNLDAEDELARGVVGTRAAAMQSRIQGLIPVLAGLLTPGDVVLSETETVRLPRGAYVGCAWCPTPGALRVMDRAGAALPQAPSMAVLRAANHRGMCASLGQTLPGACWARSVETVADTVSHPSVGDGWLVKRALGYAGRGRLRVPQGALTDAARAWVLASTRHGEGVQVEPWVERAGDYGLHGWLSRTGEITWGDVTMQSVDAWGAWQATRRASRDELTAVEHQALAHAAGQAVEALRVLGYWGALGVDAFRWRDDHGGLHWNPRCEVNARYSMGWAVGMADRRVDG